MNVRWVRPDPCFAVKSHDDGGKVFVNFCQSVEIEVTSMPSSSLSANSHQKKVASIPYSLTKPRKDVDKRMCASLNSNAKSVTSAWCAISLYTPPQCFDFHDPRLFLWE